MGLHALILDDSVRANIRAVVDHASQPANVYDITGNPSFVPGDDPRFVVNTGTVRAVFTLTRLRTEDGGIDTVRHLSVSVVPPRDAYPSLITVYTLAHEFGFTGATPVKGTTDLYDSPGPDWLVIPKPASSIDPISNIAVVQTVAPKPAADRVRELSEMPAGWHGAYPSDAITDLATSRALALLEAVPAAMPTPHVGPTLEGGIHLEWNTDNRGLELHVHPDGSVSVVTDVVGKIVGEKHLGKQDRDEDVLLNLVEWLNSPKPPTRGLDE